jgi:hypothetical protein
VDNDIRAVRATAIAGVSYLVALVWFRWRS